MPDAGFLTPPETPDTSFLPGAVPSVLAKLRALGRGHGNDRWLAQMHGSWSRGVGALPDFMGLSPANFRAMAAHHFPRLPARFRKLRGREIPANRIDEWDDLRRLLLTHRAGRGRSEVWIAEAVAAGCLASDHLWQDLGLLNRRELSAMLAFNFPRLAARNTKDMKWKKFLYKQLCEAEGVYICRAPSCEVCVDYDFCFGPED